MTVGGVRRAAVTALTALVKARSAALEAELPLLVEAVLKPLDPSVPALREGLLSASTTALREVVKRYPMVHFHQATQRLVVGAVDGVLLLYDIRTATKWRILRGHTHAISAAAFSPSGEHVASFSAAEGALRWWSAGTGGLFSFLGLQGACLHTEAIDPVPAPSAVDPRDAYALEWTSPAEVTLSCDKAAVVTCAAPFAAARQ